MAQNAKYIKFTKIIISNEKFRLMIENVNIGLAYKKKYKASSGFLDYKTSRETMKIEMLCNRGGRYISCDIK